MKKKLTPEERDNRFALIAFGLFLLFVLGCAALIVLFPVK